MARYTVLALLALTGPAAGDSRWNVGVRVAAAYGVLSEKTWAYPELDVLGEYRLTPRAFVTFGGGYAPLDNHTYLADGRFYRLELAGGALLAHDDVRVTGAFGLESVTFHADPDVVTDHPGVDILASRSAVLPSVGVAATHRLTSFSDLGVYTRLALTKLELWTAPNGDSDSARLWLAGAQLDVRFR
jgi:hypothetical protein